MDNLILLEREIEILTEMTETNDLSTLIKCYNKLSLLLNEFIGSTESKMSQLEVQCLILKELESILNPKLKELDLKIKKFDCFDSLTILNSLNNEIVKLNIEDKTVFMIEEGDYSALLDRVYVRDLDSLLSTVEILVENLLSDKDAILGSNLSHLSQMTYVMNEYLKTIKTINNQTQGRKEEEEVKVIDFKLIENMIKESLTEFNNKYDSDFEFFNLE